MISMYKLTGETPSKKNNRIGLRSGKNIPSQKFQKWLRAKKIEILRQGVLCPPLDKPLKIELHFYHKDKKVRDTDNQISSILDLLKDVKVIKDDNWQIVKRISAEAFYAKYQEAWVDIFIDKA